MLSGSSNSRLEVFISSVMPATPNGKSSRVELKTLPLTVTVGPWLVVFFGVAHSLYATFLFGQRGLYFEHDTVDVSGMCIYRK